MATSFLRELSRAVEEQAKIKIMARQEGGEGNVV